MKDCYQLNEQEQVRLSNDVMDVFGKYVQTSGKESGGILLGSVYPGSHVLVERATRPGFLDKAGRYFFDRSRSRAQRIVNWHWKKSGGLGVYLGEWHTHPVGYPVPSGRDRRMIRNMFRQTEMEIDFLLLIVVGRNSIWIGIENGVSLRQLRSDNGEFANGEAILLAEGNTF